MTNDQERMLRMIGVDPDDIDGESIEKRISDLEIEAAEAIVCAEYAATITEILMGV